VTETETTMMRTGFYDAGDVACDVGERTVTVRMTFCDPGDVACDVGETMRMGFSHGDVSGAMVTATAKGPQAQHPLPPPPRLPPPP
jgi:hypothetical protein